MTQSNRPIIILGMHRSGTSLLAKLMTRMNINMGKDINNHFESGYFLRINENILRIAHTYWDYPKNINFLINEPKTYDNIIQAINKQINSSQFRKHFLGKKNIFQKINSLEDFKWGWKEPRTTITFPLWTEIFPNAKFIYLYRNGIDVAASLQKRELNRKGNINNKPYSLRCLDLERAFDVWEEYNNFFFENSGIISNNNLLLISYEDLLSFPEKILNKIASFINVNIKNQEVNKFASEINNKRACSFLHDKALMDFYERKKNTPLMIKLSYNNIKNS